MVAHVANCTASLIMPSHQVVYLLCVHLSCLAMGLTAAPEVHAELEKRSALRILTRVVRETLVSKQFLPLLREHHDIKRVGSGSVSSWDEQLGFTESKRGLLLDKRSYSDSDLCKMAVNEARISHIQKSRVQIDFLLRGT